MILIFTNKQDTHTDEVIRKLHERNIEVFRLNSEDLLSKYKVNLQIDRNGLWSGEITDEISRVLNLANLKVAWLRKPDFNFFSGKNARSEEEEFIASEMKAFINTLYSIPSLKWINDPFIANRSKVKLYLDLLVLIHELRNYKLSLSHKNQPMM